MSFDAKQNKGLLATATSEGVQCLHFTGALLPSAGVVRLAVRPSASQCLFTFSPLSPSLVCNSKHIISDCSRGACRFLKGLIAHVHRDALGEEMEGHDSPEQLLW